jgi:hypothetical protein
MKESRTLPIDPWTFIILALAVFRATRLVTTDQIFEPLRQRIWSKFPPNTFLGYLLTCNWCSSIWVSAIFVAGYILLPYATFVVSLLLALSAVAAYIAARVD